MHSLRMDAANVSWPERPQQKARQLPWMLGAIAGPAGAIAGGVIGSAIGALSGAVLEREEHRREAHDRELDDDIGVTSGSIGVPDEMKHPSVPPPEDADDEKR